MPTSSVQLGVGGGAINTANLSHLKSKIIANVKHRIVNSLQPYRPVPNPEHERGLILTLADFAVQHNVGFPQPYRAIADTGDMELYARDHFVGNEYLSGKGLKEVDIYTYLFCYPHTQVELVILIDSLIYQDYAYFYANCGVCEEEDSAPYVTLFTEYQQRYITWERGDIQGSSGIHLGANEPLPLSVLNQSKLTFISASLYAFGNGMNVLSLPTPDRDRLSLSEDRFESHITESKYEGFQLTFFVNKVYTVYEGVRDIHISGYFDLGLGDKLNLKVFSPFCVNLKDSDSVT